MRISVYAEVMRPFRVLDCLKRPINNVGGYHSRDKTSRRGACSPTPKRQSKCLQKLLPTGVSIPWLTPSVILYQQIRLERQKKVRKHSSGRVIGLIPTQCKRGSN